MNARAMRNISKAYRTLDHIENIKDLKKNNLTLAEYHAAKDFFNEINGGQMAKTPIKAVAEFYLNCGFYALKDKNGIYIVKA